MTRLLAGLIGVLIGGTWLVSAVAAQEDQAEFRVRVFGSTDTATPTAPVLLSGTSTAPSQIDLTWSTSTDNFLVAGYVVRRDGVAVATTTQLLFSDTGLAASTTYVYRVQAFDASFNYSTSSNALAITTLNPPPPTPVATTTAGAVERAAATIARVVLEDLTIETGVATTGLYVRTARPARLEIRWGRTGAYELGYLVRSSFSRTHPLLITDLEPGTRYEYEIVGATPSGISRVIAAGDFRTVLPTPSALPSNVERFEARSDGDDVQLTWELPPTFPAGSEIRVLRSHLDFPLYERDGALVYQGTGDAVVDEDILAQYSPVYYTAFVIAPDGTVSSGAVAMAYATSARSQVESPPAATPPGTTDSSLPGAFVSTPPPMVDRPTSTRGTPSAIDTQLPEPYEITVRQGDYQGTLEANPLELVPHQPFIVAVPSDRVAANLKSIFVTLVNPTDTRQTSSYLMRLNRDGSAYSATVPAPGVLGRSQLVVQIMDFEAAVVARYQTPVRFWAGEDRSIADHRTERPAQFFGGLGLGLGLAGSLWFLWWLLVWRRRRG